MEEEVEEKKVWTAKFGWKAFFSPQPLKNSGWNDILHFLQPPKKRFFRKQNYLNWIFLWNEMIMMMKEKFFIHEFKTFDENEASKRGQFFNKLAAVFDTSLGYFWNRGNIFCCRCCYFQNTFQQQLHQNIWQKKHFLVGRSRLGTNLLLARRMELWISIKVIWLPIGKFGGSVIVLVILPRAVVQ